MCAQVAVQRLFTFQFFVVDIRPLPSCARVQYNGCAILGGPNTDGHEAYVGLPYSFGCVTPNIALLLYSTCLAIIDSAHACTPNKDLATEKPKRSSLPSHTYARRLRAYSAPRVLLLHYVGLKKMRMRSLARLVHA